MNCKFLIAALILGVFLVSSPISFAEEGTTSLEILPLDEAHPRIYEVSDLNFGRHEVAESGTKISAQDDLVIKILDARKISQAWVLQVRLGKLQNEQKQTLNQVNLDVGKGRIQGDDIAGISAEAAHLTAEDDSYQTVLKSDSSVRGTYVYTIPKQAIQLTFGNDSSIGKYEGTNNWRIINAQF